MGREDVSGKLSYFNITRRMALAAATGVVTVVPLTSTTVTGQQAGTQQWVFETEGSVQSSPTIVDGTVFVGSNDGNLYAIDVETGQQQWVFETAGNVRSSPTVVDGIVFIGSNDNSLYAINAETGAQKWVYETGDSVESSPTVVNGIAFVGSVDGALYAVDAGTGDQEWNFETDGSVTSSPTVIDGTVFVGSHDDHLYAVDGNSGEQQWRFETDGNVTSSPTVVNDTVYVGSTDDHIYAINADSGEKIWSFETGTYSHVRSAPTVTNGTVFATSGNTNENLHALTTDLGEERWSFDVGREMSSPTVAGETVFVGGSHLYAIDAETGSQQWMFTLENEIKSSPTVVNGTIFVGSEEGNLHAVSAGTTDSTEGSRGRLGTLGHHETWRYADQSIDLPDDEDNTDNQNTTSSDDTTSQPPNSQPPNELLAIGGGGVFIGTLYAIRRRLSDSDSEEVDQPVEPTLPIDNPDTADFEKLRSEADTAVQTAVTADEDGDLQTAIQAYEDALVLYRAAVDELEPGAAENRATLTETIESTRESLQQVKTHSEQRTEVIETLKPAERSFQEAIVAAVENDQTIARIRFKQARDSFEDAIKMIKDSEKELLAQPIEVGVQPDRKIPSTKLSEMAVVPESVTTALADIGVKTVADIEPSDEAPWTPPSVEELEASDDLTESTVTTLTLLSWLSDQDIQEFRTVKIISRRRKQAEYGFENLS